MVVENPVIGRYEILSGLARGGMCRVYKAYDPNEDREVAIKVLDKSYAADEGHRQRFEREARAVAALRHPSIVKIHDYGGSPDAYLYLVMEFIKGPDLRRLCEERGPLPASVIACVGVELAQALGYLHKNGVIHRDLKPENVFLDSGRVVLADFGIVKAINPISPLGTAAASPQTAVIGTPGFMAPEQIEQKPLDERADWFAFGTLIYVLGTASLPYEGKNPYVIYKTIRDNVPTPLCEVRSDIPEKLSALVQECLEFDRNRRPTSATAVSTRLEKVLSAMGVIDRREVLSRYLDDSDAFPVARCTIDGTALPSSDTEHDADASWPRDGAAAEASGDYPQAPTDTEVDFDIDIAVAPVPDDDDHSCGVREPSPWASASSSSGRGVASAPSAALAEQPVKKLASNGVASDGGGKARWDTVCDFDEPTECIPYQPAQKDTRVNHWRTILLLLGALFVGVVGFWLSHASRPRTPSSAAAPYETNALASIEVRSREPTLVYVDGKNVGSSPGFAPVSVQSGWLLLELRNDKRGRLMRNIKLGVDERVTVHIDWTRRRLTIVRARGDQER